MGNGASPELLLAGNDRTFSALWVLGVEGLSNDVVEVVPHDDLVVVTVQHFPHGRNVLTHLPRVHGRYPAEPARSFPARPISDFPRCQPIPMSVQGFGDRQVAV